MKAKDLSGQRFGRLLVIERVGTRHSQALWGCRCDCGNTAHVLRAMLCNGRTRSCGCLRKELNSQRARTHGWSRSPTYNIWRTMLARCENPKSKDYFRYGGRGIVVCERWHTFANFLADMGERPERLTLERRDNDGPYHPENCEWADWKTQSKNKSGVATLRFAGKSLTIPEWSIDLGVSVTALRHRLVSGLPLERVLTPIKRNSGRRRAV